MPDGTRLTVAMFAGGVATFANLYAIQAVLPGMSRDLALTESQASLATGSARNSADNDPTLFRCAHAPVDSLCNASLCAVAKPWTPSPASGWAGVTCALDVQ